MSIKDSTKIAGSFTVRDWKELRENLPINNDLNNIDWHKAFKVFSLRVKSRFLNPIDTILKMYPKRGKGEGFSAVALQCILIEFFEAFYEGKIYYFKDKEAIKKESQKFNIAVEELEKLVPPNGYTSSASLFKFFLQREPFKDIPSNISKMFYGYFRCGLLHEASTKNSAIIRTKKKIGDNTLMELDEEGNVTLYRTPFQRELKKYLITYEKELLSSPELKKAFVRKMDDICQIKRIYYFAYGSNLSKKQMKERNLTTYESHKGFIENYKLKFNKESKDGSSKANIIQEQSEKVWGVCYELDSEGFNNLKECEKGYNEQEILVFDENRKMLLIAKTFISNKICDKLPTKDYMDKIIEGAKQHELPEDYIKNLEKQPIQD
jgi:gamma-glutamylcyclotransferase (GGCT)/AIG2-like uncharacterized protein YtfP